MIYFQGMSTLQDSLPAHLYFHQGTRLWLFPHFIQHFEEPFGTPVFFRFWIWLLWILDFNESVLAQAFFTLQLLSFIQKPLSGGKNNCSFPFSCRLLAFRTPLRFEKSLDFAYLSYACYGSTWKLQPRSESCAQHSVLKQGHVTSDAKQKRDRLAEKKHIFGRKWQTWSEYQQKSRVEPSFCNCFCNFYSNSLFARLLCSLK